MDTVVDRLIRYAKVYSESDYHAGRTVTPSTDRQFDMAKLLVEELHGLGIENARYDDKCYVYATLDATPGCEQLPAIGLIAHMDTAPDAPGEHVARKLVERHGLQVEKFIVVELLLAEGQAAGEVHPDDLVRVRGGGVERAERDEFARRDAGLLAQLAARGGLGRFVAAVALAGGNLRDDLVHRVAKLPLDDHAAVVEQRHNAHSAHVAR